MLTFFHQIPFMTFSCCNFKDDLTSVAGGGDGFGTFQPVCLAADQEGVSGHLSLTELPDSWPSCSGHHGQGTADINLSENTGIWLWRTTFFFSIPNNNKNTICSCVEE